MDRREFLLGASAAAVAATVPAVLPLVDDRAANYRLWLMMEEEASRMRALMASPAFARGLIFDGMVGTYNGMIIREVDTIDLEMRLTITPMPWVTVEDDDGREGTAGQLQLGCRAGGDGA